MRTLNWKAKMQSDFIAELPKKDKELVKTPHNPYIG